MGRESPHPKPLPHCKNCGKSLTECTCNQQAASGPGTTCRAFRVPGVSRVHPQRPTGHRVVANLTHENARPMLAARATPQDGREHGRHYQHYRHRC